MRENRGPWYLITGLLIGLALGVYFAWNVRPLQQIDTAPASLRPEFKDQYRALIASAYASNGDVVRAKARLELLDDSDTYRSLAEQAQRTLAENPGSGEARALGLLAVALGQSEGASALPSPSAIAQIVTEAPLATPTLPVTLEVEPTAAPTESAPSEATSTPEPTTAPPFVLSKQDQVCDPNITGPLLQVQALNNVGQPVPGVEGVVLWEGGEEHFYTGLKPELGLGYADFSLQPGIVYSLQLGEGGQPVNDLRAVECQTAAGDSYWGAWLLLFVQP